MSNYTDAEERRMVIRYMKMTDAQFLAKIAEGFDRDGGLAGYIADRLMRIALILEAYEASYE